MVNTRKSNKSKGKSKGKGKGGAQKAASKAAKATVSAENQRKAPPIAPPTQNSEPFAPVRSADPPNGNIADSNPINAFISPAGTNVGAAATMGDRFDTPTGADPIIGGATTNDSILPATGAAVASAGVPAALSSTEQWMKWIFAVRKNVSLFCVKKKGLLT